MAITSYITPAEALVILAELYNKDVFASSTATEQQQALNSATVAINRLDFTGEKTVSTQANEFPRDTGVTIPDGIELATALEANMLLDIKDPETEWESEFMTSQTYAGVNSKYDRDTNQSNIVSGIMSIEAYRELQPFLKDYREILMRDI